MKDSDQKLLLSFVAGAAAGAAVSSFLHSDTGQETVAKVKSELQDLEGEFKQRMNRHVQDMQSSMNELMEETGEKFEAATQRASRRMSELQAEAAQSIEEAKPETGRNSRSKS